MKTSSKFRINHNNNNNNNNYIYIYIRIIITTITTSLTILPPFQNIVALVEFIATSPASSLEISMPVLGSYSRGDRVFRLQSKRTDGIGLRADFHGPDSYRHNPKRSFIADIMYETSGTKCAEYLYVRVE